MDITITLTDPRAIDGVVATVNRRNRGRPAEEWITPQQYLQNEMENFAILLANYERIGVVTSAAFVQRFTPAEYAAISAAAEASADVAALVQQLVGSTTVQLDDPRIAPALALLTTAGLLESGRAAQIQDWEHPTEAVPPPPPEPERARDPEGRFVADDPATPQNEAWV